MVTLGDMWSLMLTFFIMLFAMSQIDATKFKKIEGTMKDTFGYNQSALKYGPPPGVNPVHSTSQSNHFPDDIVFDRAQQNSINDPEFAARKISSCDKKSKKESSNFFITKKNGAYLQKALQNEISAGLFAYSEDGNEVRLAFPSSSAFLKSADLNQRMKTALQKLEEALVETQGDVHVRSYLFESRQETPKSTYQTLLLQSAEIGNVLTANNRIPEGRVRIESLSYQLAPRLVRSMASDDNKAVFQVVVSKK